MEFGKGHDTTDFCLRPCTNLLRIIVKPCPHWRLQSPNSATKRRLQYSATIVAFSVTESPVWTGLQRHNGEVTNLLRTCYGETSVIDLAFTASNVTTSSVEDVPEPVKSAAYGGNKKAQLTQGNARQPWYIVRNSLNRPPTQDRLGLQQYQRNLYIVKKYFQCATIPSLTIWVYLYSFSRSRLSNMPTSAKFRENLNVQQFEVIQGR